MKAIYDRELDSAFSSLTGYAFSALVLLFAGIYIMVYSLAGYTQYEYVVASMSFILLLAVPILTALSITEERHRHTDQLLYSLPMSMTRIVLGKYLALVTVLAVPVVVMGLYPLVLNATAASGAIALKSAYSALVGFFFLGAALISVGMFISSQTEHITFSFLISFGVMLLLYFMKSLAEYIPDDAAVSLAAFTVLIVLLGVLLWRMTKNVSFSVGAAVILEGALLVCWFVMKSRFTGLFAEVVAYLALFDRYGNFVYSVLDLQAIVYYLTVIGVFLFLTVQSMEKRRWN